MRRIIRKLARALGLEVERTSLYSRDDLRLQRFLALNEIDLVLDVGANYGQFASSVLDSGFSGKVISFEPIPAVHAALKLKASAYQARWQVAPRCAVGRATSEVDFHVTQNLASSSLRKPTEKLVAEGEKYRTTEVIKVQVETLDNLLMQLNSTGSRILLKLDVQGAEMDVLLGAKHTLAKVFGVLTEHSLEELYYGQESDISVDDYIKTLDFTPWDIIPGFREASTGKLLQYDELYGKK